MTGAISSDVRARLFSDARTYHGFRQKPVDEGVLRDLYELMKWAPTSANSAPARIVFVVSAEEKEHLLSAVSSGNREQTRAAPVTAIVAWDSRFYEYLPELFPPAPKMGEGLAKDPAAADVAARRNGSLQGGYFILAARALGLDCGPMSGFDEDAVNRRWFGDGRWRVNFLCNIGYGDAAAVHPRGPRLDFNTACRIV